MSRARIETDADVEARRTALARAAAGELLGPTEVAAIFRIGHSQFHRLNRAHAFDDFRTKPAIGPKCFSGARIHRYVNGERLDTPMFGRKSRVS